MVNPIRNCLGVPIHKSPVFLYFLIPVLMVR